ncbi:hypothetical protein FRC12_018452 [Ceratobasidium sp. 428]|nr:hypothetical protein FRC12_018452 [Ceratobasidium sp. 428]
MDNWLCNLSGLPGCWFPMDLMQEHSIRELKEKSQRRDEDFEADFFQDVISRNVSRFAEIKSIINKSVGLQNRSAAHGSKKSLATATQLRKALETGRTHYFIAGRSYGWCAQDDFGAGFEKLPLKVTQFLRNTCVIVGDIPASAPDNLPTEPTDQGNKGGDEPESEEDLSDELGDLDLPAPVMLVDGRVVIEAAEDDGQSEGEWD